MPGLKRKRPATRKKVAKEPSPMMEMEVDDMETDGLARLRDGQSSVASTSSDAPDMEEDTPIGRREALLACVSDADRIDQLTDFVTKHNDKGDVINLKEIWTGMSQSAKEEFWENATKVMTDLLRSGVSEAESSVNSTKRLRSLIFMLTLCIDADVEVVPAGLIKSTLVLHDFLPKTLEQLSADVANDVSFMLEKWWKLNFPDRLKFIINPLLYLLQPTNISAARVKRLWALKETLDVLPLDEPSMDALRRSLVSFPHAVEKCKSEDARRFLAHLLQLPFLAEVHVELKHSVAKNGGAMAVFAGEIYYKAWKSADGADVRERIEKTCIQDVLLYAVCGNTKIALLMGKTVIDARAEYFQIMDVFVNRRDVKVFGMLHNLLNPILWRNIEVPFAPIRLNAAKVFFKVYPLLTGVKSGNTAAEMEHQQKTVVMALLNDECAAVRRASVIGVCQMCRDKWEVMPMPLLKAVLEKISNDSAADASDIGVRAAVYHGLALLTKNVSCINALEKVLPKIVPNGINDLSEKVRSSVVQLLTAMKQNTNIKTRKMVDVKVLVNALGVETSPPVCRQLCVFLMPLFFPTEKSLVVRLTRLKCLIDMNIVAARQMARFVAASRSVDFMVKQICLCLLVVRCTARRMSTDEEDDASSADETSTSLMTEASEDDDDMRAAAEVVVANDDKENEPEGTSLVPSMAGFIDCAAIMWTSIVTTLREAAYEKERRHLYKQTARVLPKCISFFEDQQITRSFFYIGSLLPSDYVKYLSKSVMKKLHNLQLKKAGGSVEGLETECDALLQAACSWSMPELIDMISEWLDTITGANGKKKTATVSPRKNGRGVKFTEETSAAMDNPTVGLRYLLWMMENSAIRLLLVSSKSCYLLKKPYVQLEAAKVLLLAGVIRDNETEADIRSDNPPVSAADLILCLKVQAIINVILVNEQDGLEQAIDWMRRQMEWTRLELFPVLTKMIDMRINYDGRQSLIECCRTLLNAIEQSLIVGVGDYNLVLDIGHFIEFIAEDCPVALLPSVFRVTFQLNEFCMHMDSEKEDANVFEMISKLLVHLLGDIWAHLTTGDDVSRETRNVVFDTAEPLRATMLAMCCGSDQAPTDDIYGSLAIACICALEKNNADNNGVDDPNDFELPPRCEFVIRRVVSKQPVLICGVMDALMQALRTNSLVEVNSDKRTLFRFGAAAQLIALLSSAGGGLASSTVITGKQFISDGVKRLTGSNEDIVQQIYELIQD